MKAKEFLNRIRWIDTYIENRQADIERWRERAMSITVQPKTQVKVVDGEYVKTILPPTYSGGGVSDKIGEAVATYVDIQNESIQTLIDERKRIVAVLDYIENLMYFEILFKRYVLHKSFKEVAVDMDKSYSQITTAHGRALVELQKILDEVYKND